MKERKAFGVAIFEHQAVQFKLAEMATEIEVREAEQARTLEAVQVVALPARVVVALERIDVVLSDELALRADLQSLVPGTEIDLTILDAATPVLRYEVVATGRRLFARNESRADEIELSWVSHYLDTAYLRRIQQDLQREALE